MDVGTQTIPQLQALLGGGSLTPQNAAFNWNPTQQQLEQTPGYQFALQQGMKNMNNQLAAKGLNLSGAQAKGLAGYATGLADQTYQQQFQNALSQYQQNQSNFGMNYGINSDQYNRLAGLLGLGQSSAAGVGNAGMQTANQAGNYATQAANAAAAGQIAAGNSQSNAMNSLFNLGLGGAGIFSLLSDARHKRDIRYLGTTEGGHKVYSFRYKNSDEVHVGVMAQEAERIRPDSVIDFGGTKYVDYSKVS
jgi:hypothetical protein